MKWRDVWKKDPGLAGIGEVPVAGCLPFGRCVEAVVWRTSYRTCRQIARKLEEQVDLFSTDEDGLSKRLWLLVVLDRLKNGDRL